MLISRLDHHLAIDTSGTTPCKLGHKPRTTPTWILSPFCPTLLSLIVVNLEELIVSLLRDIWRFRNALWCLPVIGTPNYWGEGLTWVVFAHCGSSFRVYFSYWMITNKIHRSSELWPFGACLEEVRWVTFMLWKCCSCHSLTAIWIA